VPDPAAVWKEYSELALHPFMVALAFLTLGRLLRVAVGRWFYD
jgi:hypothetical protein